jgi:hypothetical protein
VAMNMFCSGHRRTMLAVNGSISCKLRGASRMELHCRDTGSNYLRSHRFARPFNATSRKVAGSIPDDVTDFFSQFI